MDNKTISTDSMLKYYRELDYIEFKYKNLLAKYDTDMNLYLEFYQKLCKYEQAQQFSELTAREYGSLYETLKMAYQDDTKVPDEFIEAFNLINDKIICRYVNIDGLQRLFSEKYAEFEWEMHLGINHEKHAMEYYRDHFIHQIKDAYTMVCLMEEFDFYEKVKDILLNGTTKEAIYVQNMVNQQMYCYNKLPKGSRTNTDAEYREHYIYNIIYMASYLAGLFHDIGYPMAAGRNNSRRRLDFLPESYYFEKDNFDFSHIMTLLQNSLLFKVVSPQEIRTRIDGEAIDHGALSALMFLLHFYESGAIRKLEPYKTCAVELAALAIYNHTNKYVYLETEKKAIKKAQYERCIFAQYPISYLLRISDDLQEWGRIYFEVSNQSNLICCERCHMLIVKKNKEDGKDNKSLKYWCACSEENALFSRALSSGEFPYRRLYTVTVCEDMDIKVDNYQIDKIELNYKLGRLLRIAYINPNYAKYRTEDLAKVKRLFTRQRSIGKVYISYFITANIILIKAQIVGKWVEKQFCKQLKKQCCKCIEKQRCKCMEKQRCERLDNSIMNILSQKDERRFQFIRAKVNSYWNNYFADKVVAVDGITIDKPIFLDYMEKAVKTYLYSYFMLKVGAALNRKKDENSRDALREINDKWKKLSWQKDFYTKDAEVLLDDCIEQAVNGIEDLEGFDYYPAQYFDMFLPYTGADEEESKKRKSARFYQAVNNFKELDKYSYPEYPNGEMDAYTDIYFISELLKDLEK